MIPAGNRHPVSGRARSVGGIVLCGGDSRRMECDKAWLPFGGETLLSRIVRITKQVVSPVAGVWIAPITPLLPNAKNRSSRV